MPFPYSTEHYQIEQYIAENSIYTFERFLFNEPFHLLSQPCEKKYTFFLTKETEIAGRFTVFVENKKAFSPFRGTFGSVELNDNLPIEIISFFIEKVEVFLREMGVNEILIKHYPFCYSQNPELIQVSLLNLNYSVLFEELNQHIDVTNVPLEGRLHISEKRKLKKSISAGFVFEEEKNPDLKQVYEFVEKCRVRKKFPISLPFEDFKRLFIKFPDYYQVFTVRHKTNLAALTVTVKVNSRILYNFYPADDENFLPYSPVVFLTNQLYNFCFEKGFKILDMGISTDKGIPNDGLIRFKQNLGAKSSLKLSFTKKL